MFTKEKAKSRALWPCPTNSNRTINMDHINVWHGVLTFTAYSYNYLSNRTQNTDSSTEIIIHQ